MTFKDLAKITLRFPYLFQRAPQSDRLQLGCGTHVLPGWINADMLPDKGVVYVNVAKPLPFREASFRYVFSEHLIEHLPYATGLRLLQEIHRVLAAGGKARIATPDLAFLVRLYENPNQEYINWAANFAHFSPPTTVHAINNFFRAWGHQFIWDRPTMQHALESLGFSEIVMCSPGESEDPILRGIEGHGKSITDKWNALETFVVEATKHSV